MANSPSCASSLGITWITHTSWCSSSTMDFPAWINIRIRKGRPSPKSMSKMLEPIALATAMSPYPSRATNMELRQSYREENSEVRKRPECSKRRARFSFGQPDEMIPTERWWLLRACLSAYKFGYWSQLNFLAPSSLSMGCVMPSRGVLATFCDTAPGWNDSVW